METVWAGIVFIAVVALIFAAFAWAERRAGAREPLDEDDYDSRQY